MKNKRHFLNFKHYKTQTKHLNNYLFVHLIFFHHKIRLFIIAMNFFKPKLKLIRSNIF